ncbi:hypothetical protein BY996DRAFT_8690380 [Phakopsora pachyrhizi]|nr:hypothetical protein BY996DRAFT_8690380 [Phakopsora pachyrhizi]
MSSENKQLFSSKDEDTHPKKYFKTKATNNICHPSFLAGTSQQDMFLNPTSNFSKEPLEVLGDDPFELLIQTLEAQLEIQPVQESFICNLSQDFIRIMLHQLLISTDVESYTKGTDSESRVIGKSLFSLAMNNLQNKPKEWKLKYLPKSFCTEENEAHSIILKNIIVQEGNPEQQIPRLIELAKLIKEKFRDKNIQRRFALLHVCAAYQHFCNHEAPWPKIDDELEKLKKKNSKYRNVYLSKKMASKIDFSMVVLPTDLQVEQELIKDSDSSQNNGFTSEE